MSYVNIRFTDRYARPSEQPYARGFDFGLGRDGRADHIAYTYTAPTSDTLISQPLPLRESLNETSRAIHGAMLINSGIDDIVVTHSGTGRPCIAQWSNHFNSTTESARLTQAPKSVRELIAAAMKFQPVVEAELRSLQK